MEKKLILYSIFTSLIIYVTYIIYTIYVERVFYSDGAAHFLSAIVSDTILSGAGGLARKFSAYLTMFPFRIALYYTDDMRILAIIFGSCHFFMPIIMLAYCVSLCYRAKSFNPLIFVCATLVFSIPCQMYAVNFAISAEMAAWIIILYIILQLKKNIFDYIIITLYCIYGFNAHEAYIFFGPTIAIISIYYALKKKTEEKGLLFFIAVISLSHSLYTTYFCFAHLNSSSYGANDYLIGMIFALKNIYQPRVLCFVVNIIFFFAFLFFNNKHILFISLICVMLSNGYLSIYTMIHPDSVFPVVHGLRTMFCLFVPLFSLSYLYYGMKHARNLIIFKTIRNYFIMFICICSVSFSIIEFTNSYEYKIYRDVCKSVLTNSTYADYKDIAKHATNKEYLLWYNNDWTLPHFGLILMKTRYVTHMFVPELVMPWQSFDIPKSITAIDNLDSYFDFSQYHGIRHINNDGKRYRHGKLVEQP